MGTSLARRATEIAAAERDDRGTRAGALLARVASLALALLLALQVAGSQCHLGARLVAAADAKIDARTVALASLGAAIGQPVTLCEHGGDPSHHGDPADSGRCDHCIFCHSIAVGITAAPVVAVAVARPARATDVERPREDVAFAGPRHLGNATPRGPPRLG